MDGFNKWGEEIPVDFRRMKCRLFALLLFLLPAQVALGQVTSPPVTVAFPQLAMGGDTDGQNYVTIIQVVNNNSGTITGHIALFSDSGSPLGVLFDGQG